MPFITLYEAGDALPKDRLVEENFVSYSVREEVEGFAQEVNLPAAGFEEDADLLTDIGEGNGRVML